jgi:hypothetical protein
MRQISGKACLAAMMIAIGCIWSGAASAMAAYVVGDQLILSGQVVDGDAERVADALASSSSVITTVILRNSPGGDSATGAKIAEMMRQRGLGTAVSGFCYSVCGRIFLGGRTRRFTDDYAPEFTNVGFHGYYQGTTLDPTSVQRLGLRAWYIRYSDGKADPALIDRWLSLPVSSGVIHFYNPAKVQRDGVSTFLCQGTERDVESCEHVRETALDVGVVTSLDLVHSADLARMAQLRVAHFR